MCEETLSDDFVMMRNHILGILYLDEDAGVDGSPSEEGESHWVNINKENQIHQVLSLEVHIRKQTELILGEIHHMRG